MKEETKDLEKFLKPFGKDITETVMHLREFVWDQYPQCNELIYDNYNALAFGWSPTEKVGHTFLFHSRWQNQQEYSFWFLLGK